MHDSRNASDSESRHAQQARWSAELERDRVAATIMEPGIGYAGPGAADKKAATGGEESSDEGGSAASEAAEALVKAKGNFWLALLLFIKKHPLLAALTVSFALMLSFVQFMPHIIIVSCLADKSCVIDIGGAVISLAWQNTINYIFGK